MKFCFVILIPGKGIGREMEKKSWSPEIVQRFWKGSWSRGWVKRK